MNMMFGIAVAAFSAVAAMLVIYAVPSWVWKAILPAPWKKWRKRLVVLAALLFFGVAVFTNLSTYGPRIRVTSTPAPAPERVEVEEGSEFIEKVDRFGGARERLEN